MKRVLLLAAAAAGAACVPVPEAMIPEMTSTRPPITDGVFLGLDPGAKEVGSLHFLVRAYGTGVPERISQTAENLYSRIMNDTGLYSFRPRGLYNVVVYGSADEFKKKTQFADWATGLTVGNAIYSYEGPHLASVLAHEMSHLIFHEYMGGMRQELRWINEGLAVYEEAEASGRPPGARMAGVSEPIPFEQMTVLVPASERERQVSQWYRQVGDVVAFMIERGGRIGFSQFLEGLRERRPVDEAVRRGFPGVWSSLGDVESAWRRAQR